MTNRPGALPLLLLAALLLPLLLPSVRGALASPDRDGGSTGAARELAEHRPRKHKHHLLLLMGGAKSLAALVLIKIKIVLVVAAIVAVVVFTIKYLLGAAGLPELPGLLYKGNPAPPQYPPQPPSYLPVVHEPLYGYGYPTPVPWDLDHHHEEYKNEWSKVGNGGRSSISDVKTLSKKKFNYRRKKRRI